MSGFRHCGKPHCYGNAVTMVVARQPDGLIGFGYWACDLHEPEAFWQACKQALQKDQAFEIVLLNAADVEEIHS